MNGFNSRSNHFFKENFWRKILLVRDIQNWISSSTDEIDFDELETLIQISLHILRVSFIPRCGSVDFIERPVEQLVNILAAKVFPLAWLFIYRRVHQGGKQ